MYYKHSNPIAIRSQHMVADALISLMRRQPFHKITITQICREAAIGRKTFYRNFELKEDVIDFLLDILYREYEAELDQVPLEQKLHYHFLFLKKHMELITLLYQNGLLPELTTKFSALTPKTMPQWSEDMVEQAYHSAYIVAGINAVVKTWVERGFVESVEDVTAIALRTQRLSTSIDF